MTKELKYGETPWDDMSKEELLRVVQRMWCAMIELESVTQLMRGLDAGPFWSKHGTGGRALEMSRQIRAAIDCEPGSERNENLYHCFFRYATDLLFDSSKGYRMGMNWRVCEKEGKTWARGPRDSPPTTCADCGEPLRPLEWRDVLPKEKR